MIILIMGNREVFGRANLRRAKFLNCAIALTQANRLTDEGFHSPAQTGQRCE